MWETAEGNLEAFELIREDPSIPANLDTRPETSKVIEIVGWYNDAKKDMIQAKLDMLQGIGRPFEVQFAGLSLVELDIREEADRLDLIARHAHNTANADLLQDFDFDSFLNGGDAEAFDFQESEMHDG